MKRRCIKRRGKRCVKWSGSKKTSSKHVDVIVSGKSNLAEVVSSEIDTVFGIGNVDRVGTKLYSGGRRRIYHKVRVR